MKNLRRLAGISILLILVFMVIALFRYQKGEESTLLADQYELYFNDNWSLVMVGGKSEELDGAQELVREALAQGKGREVNLPYTGESGTNGIYVFRNTLPQEYAGLVMSFSSRNATVCVVLDGEVIYQHGLDEGETAASKENFVSIPPAFQEGELWIELAPFRLNAAVTMGEVKVETRDVVVIGVVGNSIADIGCCLLIVIMAIIMFVLVLIRRYTRYPARGEVFLGLTGMAAGIYCFIETDTLNIFYDIQSAYEMQEYLVLLIPLFLALYYGRNLHATYPRRFNVLFWCASINAAAQILLHTLGVCGLEDMVNISAAVVGAVCVVAIVSLAQSDGKSRNYRTWLAVLALLVLLTVGIVIVVMNAILKGGYGHRAGQYSMVVFGIVMAFLHVLQLSREYRASAEENARLLAEKVTEVERQNAQLAQAREDAEAARREALAANEAKGKFLARMSHEIRTPINAVLGMDEMILRESKEPNVKEYAMDIHMAGQTLLSLINDILDFSKIDSGKMEIVPVEYDFSSMIHDLAQMTLRRAEDKNIRLEVEVDRDIPSRLYGDDVRIRQVLTNILTNAVKYTQEGCVWLRVQGRKREETAVLRFEVEDTGIGIKEEDLPKLSAEFERIEEERNRNIEGTGLGMSITIQLLALMGSEMQVESIYGKGSKFYFELEQGIMDHTPIGDFKSRVQQIAVSYSYNARFCAPDARILVVDDNAVNRKVLRNLLKETLIQVTDAGGGLECLDLVRQNHYDLIFLDHMMPGMDGVETLHRIRELSDSPCRDTPIVVLTANAVTGAKEKYLSEGFDDFLSKPIVPEKLENMIKKMLPGELLREVSDDGARSLSMQQAGTGGLGDSLDREFSESSSEKQLRADSLGQSLEELPQVDGLDWHYAWLHLPDMDLLEYTVKAFYAQIDSAADCLEQAYGQIPKPGQPNQEHGQNAKQEPLELYRIQVHAMKSLAATVGIMPLAGVAKILEYAARDGKLDVVMSMTTVFLEEWRSYSQKLQGVFGLGIEEKEEVTDYSVIQALVEMVRLGMQEMDVDQADQLMGKLQAYEYPDEMGQNIRMLAQAVTNLDLEEVERLAGLLIGQMEKS